MSCLMYCPRVYVRTSLKTSVYWMIYPCKIKVFCLWLWLVDLLWDTHVYPSYMLSAPPHPVSTIHLAYPPLFTNTGLHLVIVTISESVVTTWKTTLHRILMSYDSDCITMGNATFKQTVSVAQRSWWESDWFKMIIDQVHFVSAYLDVSS